MDIEWAPTRVHPYISLLLSLLTHPPLLSKAYYARRDCYPASEHAGAFVFRWDNALCTHLDLFEFCPRIHNHEVPL